MILIKKLLFKLLDEIEPNDLLEVRMDKQYMNLLLANKKSILPLAIEMRPCRDNDEDLEEVYRQAFYYDEGNIDFLLAKSKFIYCLSILTSNKSLGSISSSSLNNSSLIRINSVFIFTILSR